jgi:hypothetical protein
MNYTVESGDDNMPERTNLNFQDVVEIVESLPPNQREDLIDLIHRRMIEQKRESLSKSVREARAEYKKGQVKKGPVDELLKDLSA